MVSEGVAVDELVWHARIEASCSPQIVAASKDSQQASCRKKSD